MRVTISFTSFGFNLARLRAVVELMGFTVKLLSAQRIDAVHWHLAPVHSISPRCRAQRIYGSRVPSTNELCRSSNAMSEEPDHHIVRRRLLLGTCFLPYSKDPNVLFYHGFLTKKYNTTLNRIQNAILRISSGLHSKIDRSKSTESHVMLYQRQGRFGGRFRAIPHGRVIACVLWHPGASGEVLSPCNEYALVQSSSLTDLPRAFPAIFGPLCAANN